MNLRRHIFPLAFVATFPAWEVAADPIELKAIPQQEQGSVVPGVNPDARCFAIEVTIDPAEVEGGDFLAVASIAVGLSGQDAGRTGNLLMLDLREGNRRGAFTFWHRNINLTNALPNPKPAGWKDNGEYQHPNQFMLREGEGYTVRMVVWPEGDASRVRLFVNAMDRPIEEHLVNEPIAAGTIKLFATGAGPADHPTRTSRFSEIAFHELTVEEAKALPDHRELVLQSVDFSFPPMASVGEAFRSGNMELAGNLFLRHMRSRSKPRGPDLSGLEASVLHPDWQIISDEALAGRYGTVGYFTQFADGWTDTNGDTHQWVLQTEPLRLNWEKDNGHLNRHFHWVSLAKAWEASGDRRYAKQFSDEVFDWVSREPFFWDATPTVGGLNIMDGTTFRWGYMNTSNIGRRLELTWWPAYEIFRKAPEFSDESHFAMLAGMIRQAELITNPSSFAVHDDGAAHTSIALLQTAILLPEFAASKRWRKLALARWDEVLARQFHPDGSHVSLSTGYNWATILSLENFIRFYERLGEEVPRRYLDQLEKALEHPLLLSTPSQTQIPLNDGGWSFVDDHFRRSLHWFPHREDFRWLATRGAEGAPPEPKSLYLPNAGQFLMRTGWGEGEKYLFFGAGPWGASHGKQDALNIYTQFGNHLLIRDAGRGSYSGVGNTVHAGRSLSFNTLSPDWAQENSIPHWKQDMHRGFAPPKRRWTSNDRFDYGEGTFEYGWYNAEEHIQGKWVRQVIFVKGEIPTRDGYYIVIDTVEPKEDTERTWRHPWQLNLNPPEIAVRESDRSVTAISPEVALQILPVDPTGGMQVSIVQGQEEPELLGWRVYDKTAKPYPVPTHEWKASGTFSRAWVIQMQDEEKDWPVESVEPLQANEPGEIRFAIRRKDGGSELVIRRFPGTAPSNFHSETIVGDVAVLSRDKDNRTHSRLEMTDGEDSVAASVTPPHPASEP
jgi:hypothetical protein